MRIIGLDMPFARLVNDAANMCRWNPNEAMKWFDSARSRAINPIDVANYNRAVKRACDTLNSIESSYYYNKEYQEDFWGVDVVPTRPQPLNFELSLSEYLALQNPVN